MRRAALTAFLLGLLAGCGHQQAPTPPLNISGAVTNWSSGTAMVTAPLWPSGEVLARGAVAFDGQFSIAVPGALSPAQLAGGFTAAVEGYECTTVSQEPASAGFVAIYHLGLEDTTGILALASSYEFVTGTNSVGEWGYQWFYADRPATVAAECGTTFDNRTISITYDLNLAAGWNPVRLTVTTATTTELAVDAQVLDVPETADWYHTP